MWAPHHSARRGVVAATGAVLALGALGACASAEHYVIVTIDAPPTVRGAKSITVALANAGTTRLDTLVLGTQAFPVTFSISAPGRDGALELAVDATDAAGLVVGHGTATTTVSAPTADVELDATDFVVNTDYADDQFPSDDFEANGFQLAALPDGTWTAVFRDSCIALSCNIFGRRFDATGAPVQTEAAAGSNAFPLTTELTSPSSTPAVASSATTTLVIWDFDDAVGMTSGIACRSLDAAGRANPEQIRVATEPSDVASIAALDNGDFVASWTMFPDDNDTVIRAVILHPDCTPASEVQTVSSFPGTGFRGAVTASADRVLFTWIVNGEIHSRMAATTGLFDTDETVLVPRTDTDEVVHARPTAVAGGGFVVAVRWAGVDADAPTGRIELIRLDPAGGPLGPPVVVTARSSNDNDNAESFGIASRPDASMLLAWHTCAALGDASRCGVFGRIMRAPGETGLEAVGDSFVIPTTIDGDQMRPSVVGLPAGFVAMWADASDRPPDLAGLSVRARVLRAP